jgi:hypothetical protein
MRKRHARAVGACCTVLLLLALLAQGGAAVNLDWADKFLTGRVMIRQESGSNGYVRHLWAAVEDADNRKWDPVGMQGVAGRTNAVERIESDLRETSSVCVNTTNQISRWRIYPAPSVGSDCSPTGLVFVGSTSFTKNGCAFADANHFYSHRNLPEMDFAAESQVTTNDFTGYRSRITSSTVACAGGNCGDPGSLFLDGCFTIFWLSP